MVVTAQPVPVQAGTGQTGTNLYPPEAEQLQWEFARRASYWNIFTQMLIFILPPIGQAAVPKDPRANMLFLEKSSFTGAIPFEIPHPSSPWKLREPRETAPPGPTTRALKRATLRERGWKWLIFPLWTHPGLETPWWKLQRISFSGFCLCKLGVMPTGGHVLEDGACPL